MYIFIKTLTGKTITLSCETEDRIKDLKFKIQDKESVPAVKIKLIFHGKELVNDKTLSEYSINSEDIVHMVIANSLQGRTDPSRKEAPKEEPKEEPKKIHEFPKYVAPTWKDSFLIVFIISLFKLFNLYIISPIVKTIRWIFTQLGNCLDFIYTYILTPIGKAINWLVTKLYYILSPIGKSIRWIFTQLGKTMKFIYTHLLSPIGRSIRWIFTQLGKSIKFTYTNVLSPIGRAIRWTFTQLGNGTKFIYTNGLSPIGRAIRWIFTQLGKSIKFIYTNGLSPIGRAIRWIFTQLGNGIKFIYSNVLTPIGRAIRWIFTQLGNSIKFIYNNVLTPIGRAIRWIFTQLGNSIKFIYNNVLTPIAKGIKWVFDTLGNCINWVYTQLCVNSVKHINTYLFSPIGHGANWTFKRVADAGKFTNDYLFTPFGNVLEWTFKNFFKAIKWTFGKFGDLLHLIYVDVISAIGKAIKFLWNNIFYPVLRIIGKSIKFIFKTLQGPQIAKFIGKCILKLLKYSWKCFYYIFIYPIRSFFSLFLKLWRKVFKPSTTIQYGHYTLNVTPNHGLKRQTFQHENMYYLKDAQEYSIIISNTGYFKCKCYLSIDGKDMGVFKVEAYSTYRIERPVNEQKKFKFYATSSGIGEADSDTGKLVVKFAPDIAAYPLSSSFGGGLRRDSTTVNGRIGGGGTLRQRSAGHRHTSASSSPSFFNAKQSSWAKPESFVNDNESESGPLVGETKLEGKSDQNVLETDDFETNDAAALSICARLVVKV